MDNIIRTENLSYEYEGFDADSLTVSALNDINLEIKKGSFTAVLGKNGSGKSTLAKNINGLLIPTRGVIYVNDMDTADDGLIWEIRKTAGMVFQNPDNQIVAAIVEDDVAFGPENIGVPADEIRTRIDDAMKSTGIYEVRNKAPGLLSGGQKQRVSIAGVLAMKPECIIFDEPTAMLDPKGRAEVRNIIKRLHEEGITILLITHFMEEAARADRIIIMNNGNIISDGTPAEIFSNTELIERAGLDVPAAVKIRNELRTRGFDISDDVIDMEGLADFLCRMKRSGKTYADNPDDKLQFLSQDEKVDSENKSAEGINVRGSDWAPGGLSIVVEHLSCIYNKGLPDETVALDDVSFNIKAGEFVGLIGHTGSGKSTLIQHINGLIKADSGRIFAGDMEVTAEKASMKEVRRRVGIVFQYPEYQLFEENVELDVAFGPKNLELSKEEIDSRVRTAIRQVGLDFDEIAKRSPFELSGGQKRKAAIAGVIAMKPKVLILDEPAAGLDPQAHKDIMNMIRRLHDETGCTVILVSHNMNDVVQFCDKVLVMNRGKLILSGSPAEVFRQDSLLKKSGLGLPDSGELIYMMKKRGADIRSALTNKQAAETIENYLRSKL